MDETLKKLYYLNSDLLNREFIKNKNLLEINQQLEKDLEIAYEIRKKLDEENSLLKNLLSRALEEKKYDEAHEGL